MASKRFDRDSGPIEGQRRGGVATHAPESAPPAQAPLPPDPEDRGHDREYDRTRHPVDDRPHRDHHTATSPAAEVRDRSAA